MAHSTRHTGALESAFRFWASRVSAEQDEASLATERKYWRAVDFGDGNTLAKMWNEGFDVNKRHPVTHQTALQDLAAGDARPAIRVLLKRGDVDFLVKDHEGGLPSQLAFVFGDDPPLARVLARRERLQAQEQDVLLKCTPVR